MKKSLFIKLILLLFVAVATTACVQIEGDGVVFGQHFVLGAEKTHNGDLVVFGGNVVLESGSTVKGDLLVFGGALDAESGSTIDGDTGVIGGNVTMKGQAKGDFGVLGGNANIDGTVEGDMVVFGGNANLAEAAVVMGNIKLMGGQINKAEGARVVGDIEDLNQEQHSLASEDDDDDDEVSRGGPRMTPGDFSTVGRPNFFGWIGHIVGDFFWNVALLIILGLITWLVAAFIPEQMMMVRQTVLDAVPVSFGLGLLTSVVAVVVTPLALLLLITICLAIIPIAVYAVIGVATLFGWIVIGQIIGERLLVASGRSQPSLIYSSVVGVSVLTILSNMPVIGAIPCIGFLLSLVGWLVFLVVAPTGLGAVLLTRFGTRPYTPASYGSSRPGGSGGFGGFSSAGMGPRVRWSDPAPDVSDEEAAASEAELNARIKAALAEADKLTGSDPERADQSPPIDDAPVSGGTPSSEGAPSSEGTPSNQDEAPLPKPGDEPDEKPPVA